MAKNKEKPKNRTVYYFRCEHRKIDGVQIKISLEEMVKNSWQNLGSTQSRTFDIGEERSVVGMKLTNKIAKLKNGDKPCTLFSVGIYEEGASANTISKPSKSQSELEADTFDAPINHEFLDGEGFVCLYGDHLIISPASNFRASTISSFLERLLFNGGYQQESNIINIQQVANIDVIKTIESEGVSNIVINSALYLSSIEYIKRIAPNSKNLSNLDKITKLVSGMFDTLRDDDTDSDILEKEGLNARIVISHDGRVSGEHSEQGHNHAQKAAMLLANADVAGYVITTKNGTKLTSEDTVLKYTVKVQRHGKSVNRDKIWERLVEGLEKYEREGVLEQ
ncbi:TPA: hypothetical protein P2Q98_000740 [Aeromonas veronii]|uniref:hypothetical protein n=1 Tax=Aeromonas veronii TaxID=654 RepID=UPI0033096799|nr:hypothetical protein [Aeromonas veronii]HDO1332618.1 hypothetical protein [Aeromonas veronii]HDO1336489.1 hypothetical protein [Aeromonas veronii]HDO1341690.1 hypothetical protein [Aeromonas veronii]HDO1346054.1 hypothetical protein [Aeromonas veronii]